MAEYKDLYVGRTAITGAELSATFDRIPVLDASDADEPHKYITPQQLSLFVMGAIIPSVTGHGGKFLKTDGTTMSWELALPAQATHSGKLLTTNGTAASWSDTVDALNADTISVSALWVQDVMTQEPDLLESDTSIAIDLSNSNIFEIEVDENLTIANPTSLDHKGIFYFKLINSGSFTVAWGNKYLFEGGTDPTATVSGTDMLCFYNDGTNLNIVSIAQDLS